MIIKPGVSPLPKLKNRKRLPLEFQLLTTTQVPPHLSPKMTLRLNGLLLEEGWSKPFEVCVKVRWARGNAVSDSATSLWMVATRGRVTYMTSYPVMIHEYNILGSLCT